MNFNNCKLIDNVYHNELCTITNKFEQQYLAARLKEGRVYSDEILKSLPDIDVNHPLFNEWILRKESAQRMLKYCRNKKIKNILEVGAGNGWLSSLLASIPTLEIVGVDVNLGELRQAAKVFQKSNLFFLYDEFSLPEFLDQKFDIIFFAASIQYFPSFKEVINLGLSRLSENGEIHIFDTNFYTGSTVNTARQKTINYYSSLGFPSMADNYFHHCIENIRYFNYKVLYDPSSLYNKFSGNKNPFRWICIKK